MKVTIIAGARPNFMKVAPIIEEIRRRSQAGINISFELVHTGQHYDKEMSEGFFDDLNIPKPNANLAAGGGSQTEQTANIMLRFENYIVNNPTDLVLVVGDVTSTMACALVAQKLHIKVAHVEAGIRSGDWRMPEEINRLVTDSICNYFFTTTLDAGNILKNEGKLDRNIFFVGNTMIDTLLKNYSRFKKPDFWNLIPLSNRSYIVLTLHRPSNVDNENDLKVLIDTIVKSSNGYPIIFPAHPRTAAKISNVDINASNLHIINPLSYLEFNYLVKNSLAVITDSGGITEETTIMGVPCMTLRENTERPETCSIGTNELLGTDPHAIIPAFQKLFEKRWKKGSIPELWDGHAAKRIVDKLIELWHLQ